jgi:hypothetical protein
VLLSTKKSLQSLIETVQSQHERNISPDKRTDYHKLHRPDYIYMTPIRITPEVPMHICVKERELESVSPTMESFITDKVVYVRPEGKNQDHNVSVDGFRNEPGGIIESQRVSPGHSLDKITLTTAEDEELSGELGLSEVKIDGIIYTATNPSEHLKG